MLQVSNRHTMIVIGTWLKKKYIEEGATETGGSPCGMLSSLLIDTCVTRAVASALPAFEKGISSFCF